MSSKDLLAAGETVLPDIERIARGLACYPKKRQTVDLETSKAADSQKQKPTYKTIRQAAFGNCSHRADQKDLAK
jgi:hypothetical protein